MPPPHLSSLSSTRYGRLDSLPSSLACRWEPADRQALGEAYRDVEGDPEGARHDDRGPAEGKIEERDRVLDLDAERDRRAAEVVADDRADHREHRRHLEPGEYERQGRWDP